MTKKLLIWIFALLLLCSIAYADPNLNLSQYYNFSTDTTDFMGNCDMDNQGATPTGGILNNAYYFDGINDYMNCTEMTGYEDTANWTLNLWYKGVESRMGANYVYGFMSRGETDSYIFLGLNTGQPAISHYNAAWIQTPNTGINVNTDDWYMLTYVNYVDATMDIYVNGTLKASGSSAMDAAQTWRSSKLMKSGSQFTNGTIDEVGVWNRSLPLDDIQTLYNSHSACGPPFACGTPPTANFSITLIDEWNSTSIISFNATVNGTIYESNATGVIETNIISNNSNPFDIVIWGVADYFNRTYTQYNVSDSGDLIAEIHQAKICLNASAKLSQSPVLGVTFTIDGVSQTCYNISTGLYSIQADKSDWYSINQSLTVSPLENLTVTVENMTYANLTISAIDGTTNQSLIGYDISINSINHSGWPGESAGAVTNHSFYLINGTYNVSIDMPGYALTDANANISVNGHTNYTFVLYKTNSVQIYIRDEITGAFITDNVIIRWTSNATTWENTTDSGSIFISNITSDEYELLFYSSNYSTRSYTITVGNRSTQVLTAYMISSTYSTIFTIKDIDTGVILDGVSITMYKQINSTWTPVESKFSDISGKAQFYYDPIAHYRFYLSNTGYEDYVFYLNPILFSTYDVFMTRSDVLNYSVDFDGISFIYSPTQFFNNQNVSFNFLISSPDGLLTDYGITLTYPGGTDSASGINAIGEQLTADVNLSNATVFDYVVLEFNYTTSLPGTRNYVVNLPITINHSAGTWLTNKDKTYGMGIFERMLIATIIIIFTVGIATMVGQALPGVALGLFVFGFLTFIGFIPLWAILPSMVVGVLFLIWKSGGY